MSVMNRRHSSVCCWQRSTGRCENFPSPAFETKVPCRRNWVSSFCRYPNLLRTPWQSPTSQHPPLSSASHASATTARLH